MPFPNISRRHVVKGCLFAAAIHFLLLSISTYITYAKSEEDVGDFIKQKLLRERESEAATYRVAWKTPQMATFFEPVPGGCCGASEQGHLNLVSAWEKSWQKRGWATTVLNMEDAKKHPDFEKLNLILDNLGVNEYDKRCFYRWLAMSANGGGWMSDYDTFPLNFDAEVGAKLSEYGLFTSFDAHIPSLISAAKHEWERVLQLMIERLEARKKEDGFISDMMVLLDIKKTMGKKAGRFAREETLVAPGLGFVYRTVDETSRLVDCERIKDMLVVHCSHSSTDDAYQKGFFPIVGLENMHDALERRSEAAMIFLDDFDKQCKEIVQVVK